MMARLHPCKFRLGGPKDRARDFCHHPTDQVCLKVMELEMGEFQTGGEKGNGVFCSVVGGEEEC
jgi:hypothetical protein